ncbi:hypothetical protein [Aliiglaciecola aliphaticivorans]
MYLVASKTKQLNTFVLMIASVLFLNTSVNAKSFMFEVDVNEYFPPLIRTDQSPYLRDTDSDFSPSLESKFYQLGNKKLYVTKIEGEYEELYSLDLSSDEVILPLSNYYPNSNEFKRSSISIKPFSNNEILVHTVKLNNDTELYITDGTVEGTRTWKPPYPKISNSPFNNWHAFQRFEWKNDNDDYYYSFGGTVFKYNDISKEVV